jgi:hypothetical protein
MKREIGNTLIALILGALSLYAYFALIGIVAVWSMENHLVRWIYYLPKSIQATAYLLHTNLEEGVVAVPVLGLSGIILGIIVNKSPAFFGFMGFLGALSFYLIQHYFVLSGNFMWIESVPAWSQLLPFIMWLFIFLYAPVFGNKKLKWFFIKSEKG